MLDLFELERLFSNWLKARSPYSCRVHPEFTDNGNGIHTITVNIYRVDNNGKEDLLKVISSGGKNTEKVWDNIFDKMFAYFMEVAKDVE